MVPILHPRLPEAARAIRTSRMMELTGTEKTAAKKVAIDQEVFDFAQMLAPDVKGLEKTATGLVRLASSLFGLQGKKFAAVSDLQTNPVLRDASDKLAAVGVIEDTLNGMDTKLAHETRQLNRGYGTAVLCDLLSKT